jgi:hypothetical protein
MRFNGEWLLGADGVLRPVLSAEVLLPDGSRGPPLSSWTPERTAPSSSLT